MPTYEYQCDACEHNFDEFQAMSDKPLKKCPKCGKQKLRRVFGAGAAIIFKGSGFYQTDYRSDSYQKAAKADQESPKESTSEKGTVGDKSPAKDTTGTTGAADQASPAKESKSVKKSSKSKS